MTRNEYDELFEQLCYGHEAEILYNGKQYFLEWENLKLVVYDITDNDGKKVTEFIGVDNASIVNKLFDTPFLENAQLNKIYNHVEIIDIE